MSDYSIIGHLHTPYTDNFGVPRQPGLVNSTAELILQPPYNNPDAFLGIEAYSHVWILFLFHQNLAQGWQTKVRPPRLGGNAKLGVFATRSPYRPNGIGMSVARLISADIAEKSSLMLAGLDCLNNTPVLDIKPYIPYSDSINASSEWAADKPKLIFTVIYSAQAQDKLAKINDARLKPLIDEMLAFDCRPAYKKDKVDSKIYANRLYHYDIHWQVEANTVLVLDIDTLIKEKNT